MAYTFTRHAGQHSWPTIDSAAGMIHGLDAFNAVLDKYTVAGLVLKPKDFGVRPAA